MGDHERRWLLKTAGRWPWKSESAKECVTTHLPKQLALKMDGAVASCLHSAVGGTEAGPLSRGVRALRPRRVGGRGGVRRRVRARARLEPPPAQILVVVAITPARPWRTDVEKGFL